ncbi:MAG: hypothetical protein ACTSPQ_15725 [Candidatus Helarchaeota archaeon]
MEFKETKLRNIKLELDPFEILKSIKENKPKQCCFKRREIDGFIIGCTRAIYKGRIPLELTKNKKELRDAIYLAELKDKDEIIFIIQIIAYSHLLKKFENNEDIKKNIHSILIDFKRCIEIAEQYFKGGWETPSEYNFKTICLSENPDTELINDIHFNDDY